MHEPSSFFLIAGRFNQISYDLRTKIAPTRPGAKGLDHASSWSGDAGRKTRWIGMTGWPTGLWFPCEKWGNSPTMMIEAARIRISWGFLDMKMVIWLWQKLGCKHEAWNGGLTDWLTQNFYIWGNGLMDSSVNWFKMIQTCRVSKIGHVSWVQLMGTKGAQWNTGDVFWVSFHYQ